MNRSRTANLGRRAVALLILLIAAWILLHFVIHIAIAIASIAVFLVALGALVWALRVLL